jgi:hypothetical protein
MILGLLTELLLFYSITNRLVHLEEENLALAAALVAEFNSLASLCASDERAITFTEDGITVDDDPRRSRSLERGLGVVLGRLDHMNVHALLLGQRVQRRVESVSDSLAGREDGSE